MEAEKELFIRHPHAGNMVLFRQCQGDREEMVPHMHVLVPVEMGYGQSRIHHFLYLGIPFPVHIVHADFSGKIPLDQFQVIIAEMAPFPGEGRHFLCRQHRRKTTHQCQVDTDPQFRHGPGQGNGLVEGLSPCHEGCTGQDSFFKGNGNGVRPDILSLTDKNLYIPLASVKGSYNAIYVTGNIVDDVMFYGRGAGSLPTASAVMGDIISTAKHIMNHSTGTGMMLTETKRIPFYSSLKLENSYYFRLIVDDVTGVLSQIASAYADNDISIKEVVQKSRIEDAAELMIITEKTPRENIIHVEKALQVLPCMRQVANIIRVLEDDRK
jgi:hypothetical protein